MPPQSAFYGKKRLNVLQHLMGSWHKEHWDSERFMWFCTLLTRTTRCLEKKREKNTIEWVRGKGLKKVMPPLPPPPSLKCISGEPNRIIRIRKIAFFLFNDCCLNGLCSSAYIWGLLQGIPTVVWRKCCGSSVTPGIVEPGVCKTPEWRLVSLNAERGEKQQVGSLFSMCSSRKLCGPETICCFSGWASQLPVSVGFVPSSHLTWNPAQWFVFVTAGSPQTLSAASLSHRHCCVTTHHRGAHILLNLQEWACGPHLITNKPA